jgi:hypothetical protein
VISDLLRIVYYFNTTLSYLKEVVVGPNNSFKDLLLFIILS